MGIGFDVAKGELVTQPNIPRTMGKITDVPTGFENRTDTTLAASGFAAGAGGTVTLGDAGAGFRLWTKGLRKNYSGDETFTIPATTGSYFLYYTPAFVKTVTTTPWTILAAEVVTAEVYYNDTTGDYFLAEERHGTSRNSLAWHRWAHFNLSSLYGSGFAASGYSLGSDALADVQVALDTGEFSDEDIILTPAAKAVGDNWDKWYREGATGPWRKGGTTDTIPAFHASNIPKINQDTGGGTWALVDMTNNYRSNVYIFATNSAESANRFMLIPGQNEYSSLASAQEEERVSDLSYGSLPTFEWIPLYKLTIQYKTSYNNNNARIIIEAIEDIRGVPNPGSAATGSAATGTDHNSLGGRSASNAHPDSAISTSATTLNGQFDNTVEVDLQDILQRLDDFGYCAAWATATDYRVGNLVRIDNKLWWCTTAHTSGTFDTDLTTNGYWYLVGSGGIAGSLQTTDATVTTIASQGVPTDVACQANVMVSAFEAATGDSRTWNLEYFVKNDSGVVTATKIAERGNYDAGASSWAAVCDVSGTTFRIRVTGEAAHTIDWHTKCDHTWF